MSEKTEQKKKKNVQPFKIEKTDPATDTDTDTDTGPFYNCKLDEFFSFFYNVSLHASFA